MSGQYAHLKLKALKLNLTLTFFKANFLPRLWVKNFQQLNKVIKVIP